MFDRGRGRPIIVIPGIQGRYEWMLPGLEALARHGRVVSFSLADEPTSGFEWRSEHGFERYVAQVIEAMGRARIERAAVCGVSYGGLIALAVGARHPDRVDRLVLASALPPSWTPDARVRAYLRAPWLMAPLFVLTSPLRLYPEIASAFPAWRERFRFIVRHVWRILRAPLSPPRMARRVRMLEPLRLSDEAASVKAPVLVITGDDPLDQVVPAAVTRDYASACERVRCVRLERTGHIGIVTQPSRFAAIVGGFVNEGAAIGSAAPKGTER